MYTATNGLPSVVLPSVWTWMRGDAFSRAWKYATTCFHSGSFRSVPGTKPITDAGVGTARPAVCAMTGQPPGTVSTAGKCAPFKGSNWRDSGPNPREILVQSAPPLPEGAEEGI